MKTKSLVDLERWFDIHPLLWENVMLRERYSGLSAVLRVDLAYRPLTLAELDPCFLRPATRHKVKEESS